MMYKLLTAAEDEGEFVRSANDAEDETPDQGATRGRQKKRRKKKKKRKGDPQAAKKGYR